MDDIDDMLVRVRDSLSGAHMDMPVETILARSRSRQDKRRQANLETAGVTGITVLAFVLTASLGGGSHAHSPNPSVIRRLAFTLVKNANGAVTLPLTLTVTHSQAFSPSALQQALSRDSIPAMCSRRASRFPPPQAQDARRRSCPTPSR